MDWIREKLNSFLNSKGRNLLIGWIAMGLTFIAAKLSLSRFATPDDILSWSNYLGAAAIYGLTHMLDHGVGNAHVADQLKQTQETVVNTAPLAPGASIPDDHSILPTHILDALMTAAASNGAQQSQQAGVVTPPTQPEVSPETSSAKP